MKVFFINDETATIDRMGAFFETYNLRLFSIAMIICLFIYSFISLVFRPYSRIVTYITAASLMVAGNQARVTLLY